MKMGQLCVTVNSNCSVNFTTNKYKSFPLFCINKLESLAIKKVCFDKKQDVHDTHKESRKNQSIINGVDAIKVQ